MTDHRSLHTLEYRKEIDGLRAIAVMSVILAHAHIPYLAGGFVGVDIFFVISGFLITSILLNDIQNGRFSLWVFYERRIRRILPALFVMVALFAPVAWFAMLPDPLENFAQSAFASVFSLNNVLLTLTSGYWDLASEFKPLLHTWSLGVEEQFYLIYPVLFLTPFVVRRAIWVVGILSLISFFLCIFLNSTYPNATFYLLHTRAWELGLGAIGAILLSKGFDFKHPALSFIGLGMIMISVIFYSPDTLFPSTYTLLPCLGALLILINRGADGLTVKLLNTPIFTAIGVISYSLYLYHQPIFAFTRILSFEAPAIQTYIFGIVLCFVMAFLSWRYVEQPFRKSKISTNLGRYVVLSGLLVCIVTASLLTYFKDGFPDRIYENGPSEVAHSTTIAYNEKIRTYHTADFSLPVTSGSKILVVGDSQARDFSNILIERGLADKTNLIYRSDISICNTASINTSTRQLLETADKVFLAYNKIPSDCLSYFLRSDDLDPKYILIGPKHFGYNLNAFLRLPYWMRPDATAKVFDPVIALNETLQAALPATHFIDMISLASRDGTHIRVFDDDGFLISADRIHITQAGAKFFAEKIANHAGLQTLRALDN